MSPGRLLAEPSFTIIPMQKELGKETNFGATIDDLDLGNISDSDVQALSDAIWTHKVVVVRGQKDLAPIKQWDLVTRFDPEANQVHSHGDLMTFKKQGGVLAQGREVLGIPGAENVRLIGKGFQGEDHYGLKNVNLSRGLGHHFHADKLPDEEFRAGFTRFHRWHIDAPLWSRDPAWFTTLRCIKRPRAPKLTVRWDDGSDLSMETEPGLTAFFSNHIGNVQAYELMTDEQKKLVDHSWVDYGPYPYMRISDCKGNANGLGLKSQGREKKVDEVGEFDPRDKKIYPMVWKNPITQEKAFMVHGICAHKLYLRSSPEEEPRVIENIEEIRAFLKPLQESVLKPEYIMIPKLEEGDIVMWANYQMFHSAVDYPEQYGDRTMHQANVGASIGPIGPVPIPTTA